jgi:hypothetical protein
MTDFSDYAENAILDHLFGQATWGAVTPYLGAYTAAPTDAGGGTEVTGGSYARVDISSLMASASGGAITNDTLISFPQATADWGTIVAVGVFDDPSAGNLLMWKSGYSKVVDTDDTLEIPVGDLDATAD